MGNVHTMYIDARMSDFVQRKLATISDSSEVKDIKRTASSGMQYEAINTPKQPIVHGGRH